MTGVGADTLRQWAGLAAASDTPAVRSARLEPIWRIVPAAQAHAGAGGAVLLSGCDGVHDSMELSTARFADRGWPALILDSYDPHGLDQYESWPLVCIRQVLGGAERAGDLAIALTSSVLPAGGAVVLGASHGDWTAMEFLRLAVTGQVPPGLQRWPTDAAQLLWGREVIVLLYPYCGRLSEADKSDWIAAPAILMILAAEDRIVSTPACQDLADLLRARGAWIKVIILLGADHGFDQREHADRLPTTLKREVSPSCQA